MADNPLNLAFSADTSSLDTAKEKIASLGEGLPSVGNLIKGLGQSFMDLPGPIGLGVAALTAFGVAAAALGEKAMDSVNSLLEMSSATGVSVQNLQVMKTAMGMTGASTDQLGEMLGHLNRTIDEAQDPTSRASVAMNMLGVSQKELASGNTAEIMQHIAQVLNQMAPGANKAALEMQIFGKSGAEADEAIKSLADNTDRAKQILADHGAVTDADVQAQKSLNAAITEASAVFEGIGLAILREVMPAITGLVQWFDNATKVSGPLAHTVETVWDALKGFGSAVLEVVKPVGSLVAALADMSGTFTKTETSGSAAHLYMNALKEDFAILTTVVKASAVAIFATAEILNTFGEAIVRAGNAMADVASGHIKQASHEFDGFTDSIKKNIDSVRDFAGSQFSQQVTTIATATTTATDATNTQTKSVGSLSAAYKELQAQNTINDLNAKWAGQKEILAGAVQGLQQYKDAEQDVEIEAEKVRLQQQGASRAQITAAETAMRGANAAKQATDQQVAGLNIVSQLQEQLNALKDHETAIDKANEQIQNNPQMTEALQNQIKALAQKVQAQTESNEVDKMAHKLTSLAVQDSQKQIEAMTLSTNALKLYTDRMKLFDQYQKDIGGKSASEIKQLTEAWQKADAEIKKNNQDVLTFEQSMKGFGAGATQAIQNTYEQSLNLNKMGQSLVTTFNSQLVSAFQNMGTEGSQAWDKMGIAMISFFEQLILKWALAKAEMAIMTGLGMTPQEAGAITAGGMSAGTVAAAKGLAFNRGSVTAFAAGGIVDGPTLTPMALMGEAGPEAVMPLSRDGNGRLGVNVNGGSTQYGTGAVHNHNNTFVINTNQDPHEVGKQVRKQVKVATNLVDKRIATQQLPGGMLARQNSRAFAR